MESTGSVTLRREGNNIVLCIVALDADGNAVISGQTIDVSILRLSEVAANELHWNDTTELFDEVAEPALEAALQVGSTGKYEYTLVNGYNADYLNYSVHIDAGGVVVQDFSVIKVLANASESLIGDLETTVTELIAALDSALAQKYLKTILDDVTKLKVLISQSNTRNLNQEGDEKNTEQPDFLRK